MALEFIKQITGTGVHISGDDIDTDRIIPARFMKCITFDGLGPYAFYDERKQEDGSDKNHPFNTEPFKQAPILLTGANFGCGSSREHAPQSLYHWGIRAIIAESFAEIFFGNSITLGIPCACSSRDDIAKLAALIEKDPTIEIKIDIESLSASAGELTIDIQIPNGTKDALIHGRWDALAELLEKPELVDKTAQKLGYV